MSAVADSVDGLPKQFVTSLRILFDILDEDGAGYVRLCDIESRWHEEGVRGLPSGVIDTLRKVAPPTGKLSFENFVTGLKFSLLKNAHSKTKDKSSHIQNGNENRVQPQKPAVANKLHSTQPQVGRTDSYHGQSQWKQQPQGWTQQSAPRTRQGNNSQHIVPPSTAVKPNNASNTNLSQNVELRNQIYNREQIQQAAKHQAKNEVSDRHQSNRIEKQETFNTRDINLYNRLQEKPPTNVYTGKPKVTYHHQQTRKDEQPKTILVGSQRQKSEDIHIAKTEEGHQSRDFVKYRNNEQSKKIFTMSHRPKSQEIYASKREENQQSHDFAQPRPNEWPLQQRPKRPPPYNSAVNRMQEQHKPPTLPPRDMNSRIMRELKTWQREHKDMNIPNHGLQTAHSDSQLMEMNRLAGDEIYVNIEEIRKHQASKAKTAQTNKEGPTNNGPQKATVRRQNSRRHTLSSGVDYNMIRRAKQLEQERDILLQGLGVVDQTRDWYRKQLTGVSGKQNFVGKASYTEGSLSANQERMDLQRARITEVSLHLKALMDSSEKRVPAHMNLAVRSGVISPESSITMLKTQNKQLTKEVGQKGEEITKLEKDKASLIRDLFEARSKHKVGYDDTTFM